MHPIADKAKMVISVPLKIQNISSENSGVSYKIKMIFNIYNYINRMSFKKLIAKKYIYTEQIP